MVLNKKEISRCSSNSVLKRAFTVVLPEVRGQSCHQQRIKMARGIDQLTDC